MSPALGGLSGLSAGFPRVSGDEPNMRSIGIECRPFSPRERG